MSLPSLSALAGWSGELVRAGLVAAIAVALALIAHFALFALFSRVARLSEAESDDELVRRLREPARWSLVAVALSIAAESQATLGWAWQGIARFVLPALLGWTALALVKAFAVLVDRRAGLSADPHVARSRQTRIAIFSRALGFVIVFVTIGLILLSIPGVRNIGVTLMASAGLAGLAVGAAAQPALKSLIAGIQMALTEPIRLGDLVVFNGGAGTVEDIRMSYVVVRTADERRIIVPTVKFLDESFQNWTRVSGGITGAVSIPIKPGHPIGPIRAAFESLLEAQPGWDRRLRQLQVADVRVGSVELKLVMSAAGPADLSNLHLAVREAMLEWLRENMPDALCDEV